MPRQPEKPRLKIVLAQINTTVGDVEGNLDRALAAHRKAARAKADLVIFPEQTFLGYPAKDLLLFRSYIRRNTEAAGQYARKTAKGPASIIGYAQHHTGPGTGLHNVAGFCRNGRIETIYVKRLLPTYDVFDEDRYFDEGEELCIVEVKGFQIGVTICEDMWNDEIHHSHRMYQCDPVLETAQAGAEVIVNISASPWTLDKRCIRRNMMSHVGARHRVPIVEVNLVGANDDLIFDGTSTVVGPDGKLAAQARSFEEDFLETVFERKHGKAIKVSGRVTRDEKPLEDLRHALVLGIRDYVKKCGFKSVLVGLSGGIDSAVVAALAVDALGPRAVHGIAMPSRHSSEHSITDAGKLAKALGFKFSIIPIEGMFAQSLNDTEPYIQGPGSGIARENMQSRLRGMVLMSVSNATGSLVLTTGNKSEMSVGYCTLYGDMNGGLAPIADVTKMMVYDLARHINRRAGKAVIPRNTLVKPPSAELSPGQMDVDSLPAYEILDPIVRGYVERHLDEAELIAEGHDPGAVRKAVSLINRNEYKRRQAAPTLKVTSRAFGFGWRMPIARK